MLAQFVLAIFIINVECYVLYCTFAQYIRVCCGLSIVTINIDYYFADFCWCVVEDVECEVV